MANAFGIGRFISFSYLKISTGSTYLGLAFKMQFQILLSIFFQLSFVLVYKATRRSYSFLSYFDLKVEQSQSLCLQNTAQIFELGDIQNGICAVILPLPSAKYPSQLPYLLRLFFNEAISMILSIAFFMNSSNLGVRNSDSSFSLKLDSTRSFLEARQFYTELTRSLTCLELSLLVGSGRRGFVSMIALLSGYLCSILTGLTVGGGRSFYEDSSSFGYYGFFIYGFFIFYFARPVQSVKKSFGQLSYFFLNLKLATVYLEMIFSTVTVSLETPMNGCISRRQSTMLNQVSNTTLNLACLINS